MFVRSCVTLCTDWGEESVKKPDFRSQVLPGELRKVYILCSTLLYLSRRCAKYHGAVQSYTAVLSYIAPCYAQKSKARVIEYKSVKIKFARHCAQNLKFGLYAQYVNFNIGAVRRHLF